MWKIIGLLESRGGDIEFLPEWSISTPGTNAFDAQSSANSVCSALNSYVEELRRKKLQEAPGVGGASTSIRYMVLPCIDPHLLAQVNGGSVAPAPQPSTPALSFSTPPRQ